MADTHVMMHEIIEEHSERIGHIRKYYPYFKLAETSFGQYKDGKYADLDMGYLVLAVLRYFIEENNFRDKEVTYPEYAAFVTGLLRRDFELYLEEEENKELVDYIFDKLRNEGKPFTYTYFDPADRKRKTLRMRLLDSRIEEGVVYYSISPDAVEFYLDTKEIKDESAISVEQLLLEKLITSQNFKGGVEVVRRINNEVSRLMARKNEVLQILSQDVFEGTRACEEFVETGMRWFDEEQKLFRKNSELIHKALERAEADEASGEYSSQYYKAMNEIYALEIELKKAIQKHRELLSAVTNLQIQADQMIVKARVSSLRSTFDFQAVMRRVMEKDRADLLGPLVQPLLNLKVKKTFYLPNIENLLTYRPDRPEAGELIVKAVEEDYIYEDELEEQRIEENYGILLRELLDMFQEYPSFTLEQWNERLGLKYSERIFRNGDYYSFLIHLSQKKAYAVDDVIRQPDTFFEELMSANLEKFETNPYKGLAFTLTMEPGKTLLLSGTFETSDILFERGEQHGEP